MSDVNASPYPSEPVTIASTIENAYEGLKRVARDKKWASWRDLNISGQIIFCEICKAIRFTRLVIADVTTLNANVLFEIGYAIGVGCARAPDS